MGTTNAPPGRSVGPPGPAMTADVTRRVQALPTALPWATAAPSLRRGGAALALALGFLLSAAPASAQLQTQYVDGVVRHAGTGAPLPGVVVRVQSGDAMTVTDADGRFRLREVPSGVWTLEVISEEHGARSYAMEVGCGGFAEVAIALGDDEVATGRTAAADSPPAAGPTGGLGHTVDAEAILRAAPGARTLGELIRQTVPAFRSRSATAVAGADFCLEFRSRSARTLDSGTPPDPDAPGSVYCNHPVVYLDGVPVQDPTFVYERSALGDIRRIQAIPPAEAAGLFSGSGNGVILVETRFAPRRGEAMGAGTSTSGRSGYVPARRSSFDWSQDPAGHNFGRTFLGALVGNAAGLAAGVAVGRQCVFVEERTQDIEFSCGNAGVAGAGLAAVALPGLGSAIGANLMGRTERSAGRFIPSVVGGMMGALPGYIFALATVGDGVGTMNTVGKGFLVVAPPLLTTVADRLFRSLR